MYNKKLTPSQQEIVDLLNDGWRLISHGKEMNFFIFTDVNFKRVRRSTWYAMRHLFEKVKSPINFIEYKLK